MDVTLQQKLDEERASLLDKLELLEKKKNEELQNLKTSLIAEQQVLRPRRKISISFTSCLAGVVWFILLTGFSGSCAGAAMFLPHFTLNQLNN